MNRDPITNEPLPPTAIQRVLFIAQTCHIYRIPPPSSPRYLTAALWTTNPQDHIFTARLRLIETAVPVAADPPTATARQQQQQQQQQLTTSTQEPTPIRQEEQEEKVTATILLEDGSSGDLFAAAPYTHITTVTQATDSSRFFAIRVVGDGGMKATLGLGFEERPVAFDFSIALQDVRRTLGLDVPTSQQSSSSSIGAGGRKQGKLTQQQQQQQDEQQQQVKRDLSLKEGEMITIKIGGKGRRTVSSSSPQQQHGMKDDPGTATLTSSNPFAIAPPPGATRATTTASSISAVPVLPPPPLSDTATSGTADDDGFDDGEFGEFQ